MRKYFFLVSLMWFTATQAQTTIHNPILGGFYPDPSIVKVNTDYYLVNSTFVYVPGIPVFHSKDLKNWKQIGSVVTRPTQMDFMGEQVSRGLFAPAISYHDGLFYITCTDIDHEGNFIMTAKNPAGPWSNPILLPKVKGIDPSLFFDDDKVYIIYNSDAPERKPLYDGHRTIRIYELDKENFSVKGEETILVNGGVDISTKPVWIEGPHIYKRNDYYYLCAAEGGTSVNHSQVILRSKNVRGPYIPYDKNPILTQRHLDPNRKNPITSAGHADLVEGSDGNTYAVFLAVRPYEGNYYNTGRETFLAPVKWTADGWPIINPDHQEIQHQFTVNWPELKQNALPQSGAFTYRHMFKDTLDYSFLFLRSHDKSWLKLSAKKGLTLQLKPETCMELSNPAFVGKRQQHAFATVVTEMDFKAAKENEKAGLLIFQNEFHFYYICKSIASGIPVIQVFKGNKASKSMDLLQEQKLTTANAKVWLKIEAKGASYNLAYAEQPKNWKVLAPHLDGKYLSTQQAGGFVGALFAIYASANGKTSTNTASFKYLDYEGVDLKQ
ncbi:Non-reducing end alpha-L-arabinofuranosidase BoGH43A [Pedobacter glucosidilyticus]|nr:glycoside hydrolase family 43 protein [Pedobacter glucosidilyticus]KHJ37355.1 Non-reducing end alpha-L-arabinofuranosidase BoGH43A [Pedobacter glucosidilyticus]